MAPTKKDDKDAKEAKLNPEQSAALILNYLRKQNRPYSATDISANLKNRITKAAAAKLLKDMHERKDIEGKAAGKQIVYHAVQEEADDLPAEELQAIETETAALRDATIALKAEEKELRASLRNTAAAPASLSELKASVDKLASEKAEVVARLAKLQAMDLKPVSLEERASVQAELRKWQKCSEARVRIRKEMWGMIAGALEKEKAEETKEALGLEF